MNRYMSWHDMTKPSRRVTISTQLKSYEEKRCYLTWWLASSSLSIKIKIQINIKIRIQIKIKIKRCYLTWTKVIGTIFSVNKGRWLNTYMSSDNWLMDISRIITVLAEKAFGSGMFFIDCWLHSFFAFWWYFSILISQFVEADVFHWPLSRAFTHSQWWERITFPHWLHLGQYWCCHISCICETFLHYFLKNDGCPVCIVFHWPHSFTMHLQWRERITYPNWLHLCDFSPLCIF